MNEKQMPLPYLTADLPGLGGRFKEEIDDFVVEEVPAYEPSGTGEHLFLWIEKRDLGAEFFQRQLAQRLAIRPEEIGMAGLKDRRAITRQWVSVPCSAEVNLPSVNGADLRVLKVERHGNKLRPGHLRGNRFRMRLRGVSLPDGELVRQYQRRLQGEGFPSYYGEQRFGRERETLELGLRLLRGEPPPRNRFLHKLALSAVQSELFNRCLAERLKRGQLHRVLAGDVLHKWPAGGMFLATQPEVEQARLNRREVVPTGPMFGKKMMAAAGEAAELENSVLQEAGLATEAFHSAGRLLQGTRRNLLCFVDDLEMELEGADLRIHVTLPAGVYATVLLRELRKADAASQQEG